ncbi:hypothetical protein P4E94_16425 [Pontiellaceae bacterium B12219]|nr:hypothetical protein [Pontiellaceae bacterium B12219]
MRHIRAKAWELKLKTVFDEIDRRLESDYGDRFRIHPARPAEGRTSNPEMDGLFNVGASYSAGFGSAYGPGYVVEIRVSTLQSISQYFREELRDLVQTWLTEMLPNTFPDRELHVVKEGNHLRIYGDLRLD